GWRCINTMSSLIESSSILMEDSCITFERCEMISSAPLSVLIKRYLISFSLNIDVKIFFSINLRFLSLSHCLTFRQDAHPVEEYKTIILNASFSLLYSVYIHF